MQRHRSRLRWMGSITAIASLALACTHDFDAFESGESDDGGGSADSGGSDSGGSDGGGTDGSVRDSGVDTGPSCLADAGCTGAAKTCSTQCQNTETTCLGGCPTNGPNKAPCRAGCQDAGTHCVADCVTTCVTCAGCNATVQCENATQ